MQEGRVIHKEENSAPYFVKCRFNSFQHSGVAIHGLFIYSHIPSWLNVKNKKTCNLIHL